MNPEITYLVANYNNGRYINDCIASLHTQTNPNWNCLIADDQSTDNSLEIIRPLLNDKVDLIENEQNIGYTATLINLIAHAPTDIVGILDPDDALYPTATAEILRVYEKHPNAGFVYSNYANFCQDLQIIKSPGYSTAISREHTSLTTGFVSHLKTFRVSHYHRTEGYDLSILYAEDRDIVYKMEEVTEFLFIDKALYKYRFVANSQGNEKEKSRIGRQNHLRAYCNALRRRGIIGLRKNCYMLLAYIRYFVGDHRLLIRVLAGILNICVTPLIKILDYHPHTVSADDSLC